MSVKTQPQINQRLTQIEERAPRSRFPGQARPRLHPPAQKRRAAHPERDRERDQALLSWRATDGGYRQSSVDARPSSLG